MYELIYRRGDKSYCIKFGDAKTPDELMDRVGRFTGHAVVVIDILAELGGPPEEGFAVNSDDKSDEVKEIVWKAKDPWYCEVDEEKEQKAHE